MATQAQIKAKVKECVALAKQKYGFDIPYSKIDITFKSKGQAAAQAWRRGLGRTAQYGLKFSMESASLDSNEMLNDTVPHEVAHLVCYWNSSLGKNHDRGWKRVCIGLGGTGARTHSQTLTKARYKTQYEYRLPNGDTTKVGPKIHKNIQQRGMTYRNRGVGSFGKSDFVRVISPDEHRREHQIKVQAARAAAGSPQVPASSHKRPTGGRTKKVKAMEIYNTYKSSSRLMVIQMFIDRLGMTKAGATTYYYNCSKA